MAEAPRQPVQQFPQNIPNKLILDSYLKKKKTILIDVMCYEINTHLHDLKDQNQTTIYKQLWHM